VGSRLEKICWKICFFLEILEKIGKLENNWNTLENLDSFAKNFGIFLENNLGIQNFSNFGKPRWGHFQKMEPAFGTWTASYFPGLMGNFHFGSIGGKGYGHLGATYGALPKDMKWAPGSMGFHIPSV